MQLFNTTTQTYSSAGCTSAGVVHGATASQCSLSCRCEHLTEVILTHAAVQLVSPASMWCRCNVLMNSLCMFVFFQFAILRAEQEKSRDGACAGDSTMGSVDYFIFMVLYSIVGCVALVQLSRIAFHLSLRRHYLMSVEYTLIATVCLFRALNHAIFYTLYEKLSFTAQTALSGIPYLFNNW